jgi:hypothetical protein
LKKYDTRIIFATSGTLEGAVGYKSKEKPSIADDWKFDKSGYYRNLKFIDWKSFLLFNPFLPYL